MPIIASRILSVRPHENADTLFVYQVEPPNQEVVQIIANNSTVYTVGDVVAAALVGTVYAGGITISKTKIRGVLSFGMLLGKVQAPLGTDLTSQYGATNVVAKPVDESQGVVPESVWPCYTSLEGFLRVKDEILAVPWVVVSEKSHGSNCRFGLHNSKFVVGTHTSRVVESRMSSSSWPEGHLVQKTLLWVERLGVQALIENWVAIHRNINSLAIYGEICGFKCSDLHYGLTSGSPFSSEVRLFGEVALNGQFLSWDAANLVLREIFGTEYRDLMVPILYQGPPDPAILKQLRDQPSALAASRGASQISEGVVIRPVGEFSSKITLGRLIAKYKSPLYEERASLRDKDPGTLPKYMTAYDLLTDFVTDERIRHVIGKMESAGVIVDKRQMKAIGTELYMDIRKESVGEWPEGDLDEATLRRWTFDLAGERIRKLIDQRV